MTDDLEPEPWFDLTDTAFIEMIWFVAFDVNGPRADDWLAIVFKDGPDHPWRISARYRSSTGGDAWNPTDTKKGFKMTAADGSPETAADVVRRVNVIFEALRADTRHRAYRVLIRGDRDRFVRILHKQKWFHARSIQAGPEQPQ